MRIDIGEKRVLDLRECTHEDHPVVLMRRVVPLPRVPVHISPVHTIPVLLEYANPREIRLIEKRESASRIFFMV